MASILEGKTPTKTESRTVVSPNTKSSLCIICGNEIISAQKRLKLFKSSEKTEACRELENALQIELNQTLTNVSCKNCVSKCRTILKNRDSLQQDFSKTKCQLEEDFKKQYVKRLHPDESNEASARRPLFNVEDLSPAPFRKIRTSYRDIATQTEDQGSEDSLASITINYPCGIRSYKLDDRKSQICKALACGSDQSFVAKLFDDTHLSNLLFSEVYKTIATELTDLCSTKTPSVLRKSTKEDLESFSWDKVGNELKDRCPRFHDCLYAIVDKPDQIHRNKHKLLSTGVLNPALYSAAAKLLSIKNREMNLIRKLNSVILKRGGAKKVCIKRLSASYDCMSYHTSNNQLEAAGKQCDARLITWQEEVKTNRRRERQLLSSIDETESQLSRHITNQLILQREDLKHQLEVHRSQSHPGFYIIGDNVDVKFQVRHMTKEHQRHDHHMFHILAFKNRIQDMTLSPTKPQYDVNTIPFSEFLPSIETNQVLIDELAVLVGQIWATFIPGMNWISEFVPKHIPHPYVKEMCQKSEEVHLGVLHESEQENEGMIRITQFMHKYVPGHSDDNPFQELTQVLTGGDYLTFERQKQAQCLKQDGITASERLEGVLPFMQDFHAQAEWQKLMFSVLYDTRSAGDTGTLYAARDTINASAVTKDPHKNYYAAYDLLDKYTDALVVTGACHFFGMKSVNEEPTQNVYEGLADDKGAKEAYVKTITRKFVEEHVVVQPPSLDEQAPTSNTLKCRFCDRVYKRPSGLQKHETKMHNFGPRQSSLSDMSSSEIDRVQVYNQCSLLLGMLRKNHNDAIHHGDGERVIRLYHYMYLFYKSCGCPKYAYGTLETLAQTKCLLPARLAHAIIWNRFVNKRGKLDTNFPNDLEIEHQNKEFKDALHSFHGSVTDKTIARISKSQEFVQSTLRNFDKCSGIKKPSGKHTQRDMTKDVHLLVKQYLKAKLFDNIPGRYHKAFPNFDSNIISNMDMAKLKTWISSSLKGFALKPFYVENDNDDE